MRSCKLRGGLSDAFDLSSRCRGGVDRGSSVLRATGSLDAAELATGAILDAPQRWSLIEAGVRRYLMPRFPFAVYYRAYPEHVRILAFKHHSRDPEYWRYRLSE
jgi:hypothetical protein